MSLEDNELITFEKKLEELLISSNLSLKEQIEYSINQFFKVCLKLDYEYVSDLKIIFNLLSKLFSKIKKINLLNSLISYYEIIQLTNKEIKKHSITKLNFNFNQDLIITPFFSEDNLQIYITSNSYEKFIFFISKLEDFLTANKNLSYLKSKIYKIKYGQFPKGHILEIKSQEKKLNINKINKDLTDFSQYKEIKKNLKKYEYLIRENFSNNRKTKEFRFTFEKFKEIILNDDSLSKDIKEIIPFGSVTQYTQTENSDLEITIIMKDYENYNESLSESFLEKIKKKLEENYINEYTNINVFQTRRTFLLDIYDKINNIKLEVNLNNIFGILNSNLIREYLLFDSRALILVNTIKNWSKIKKINGNNQGYLSSYCFTLLVIYFLQRIEKPILPVISSKNEEKLKKVKICNKEYFLEENLIEPKSSFLNFKIDNNDNISILILKFFMFYLYLFEEDIYCIDISSEKQIERKEKIEYMNSSKKSKCAYCFIDMFDYSYNPGSYMNSKSSEHNQMKEQMKKGINDILNGNNIFLND